MALHSVISPISTRLRCIRNLLLFCSELGGWQFPCIFFSCSVRHVWFRRPLLSAGLPNLPWETGYKMMVIDNGGRTGSWRNNDFKQENIKTKPQKTTSKWGYDISYWIFPESSKFMNETRTIRQYEELQLYKPQDRLIALHWYFVVIDRRLKTGWD